MSASLTLLLGLGRSWGQGRGFAELSLREDLPHSRRKVGLLWTQCAETPEGGQGAPPSRGEVRPQLGAPGGEIRQAKDKRQGWISAAAWPAPCAVNNLLARTGQL